jgi:hypothetical protein
LGIKVGGGDFSGDLEEGHLEKSFGLQVSSLRLDNPKPEPRNPKAFIYLYFFPRFLALS